MSLQLPVARVKKLIRYDPDVNLVTAEFSHAMSTACELFIRAFAKEVSIQTKVNGRKTVTLADVENCISSVSRLEFLDGALEGWGEAVDPKAQTSPDETSPDETSELAESQAEVDQSDDTAETPPVDNIAEEEKIPDETDEEIPGGIEEEVVAETSEEIPTENDRIDEDMPDDLDRMSEEMNDESDSD